MGASSVSLACGAWLGAASLCARGVSENPAPEHSLLRVVFVCATRSHPELLGCGSHTFSNLRCNPFVHRSACVHTRQKNEDGGIDDSQQSTTTSSDTIEEDVTLSRTLPAEPSGL